MTSQTLVSLYMSISYRAISEAGRSCDETIQYPPTKSYQRYTSERGSEFGGAPSVMSRGYSKVSNATIQAVYAAYNNVTSFVYYKLQLFPTITFSLHIDLSKCKCFESLAIFLE